MQMMQATVSDTTALASGVEGVVVVATVIGIGITIAAIALVRLGVISTVENIAIVIIEMTGTYYLVCIHDVC